MDRQQAVPVDAAIDGHHSGKPTLARKGDRQAFGSSATTSGLNSHSAADAAAPPTTEYLASSIGQVSGNNRLIATLNESRPHAHEHSTGTRGRAVRSTWRTSSIALHPLVTMYARMD